ncbi:hypothetical protein GE107_23910 [Cohnella sp. CFH 77786]|uniref:hypothetical protein n=1 Tax=Cohnella sp. CFH 77786 TaxID=2662265 RepID=UPI001C60A482|nr:hypothetical protein [Cohnella sp. CFH 77786]MBW5449080.1 hypothetical protein [Cohnella sp. CFH 77786]
MQLIGNKNTDALHVSVRRDIPAVTDRDLERLVRDTLEKMKDRDIRELCRALEIICCYRNPTIYH